MAVRIKVYNYGEPASIPQRSYYCQKLETYFRACELKPGTDYVVLPVEEPHRHHRKLLPYLVADGRDDFNVRDPVELVECLREHRSLCTERRCLCDLDAEVTPRQAAEIVAWKYYIESILWPCTLKVRFRKKNWTRFLAESTALGLRPHAGEANACTGGKAYECAQLADIEIPRFSDRKLEETMRDAFDAIDLRLQEHDPGAGKSCRWYADGGDRPTSLDVILYSWLVCILSTDSNRELREDGVMKWERLRRYVRHLTEQWFGEEYAELQAILEEAIERTPRGKHLNGFH